MRANSQDKRRPRSSRSNQIDSLAQISLENSRPSERNLSFKKSTVIPPAPQLSVPKETNMDTRPNPSSSSLSQTKVFSGEEGLESDFSETSREIEKSNDFHHENSNFKGLPASDVLKNDTVTLKDEESSSIVLNHPLNEVFLLGDIAAVPIHQDSLTTSSAVVITGHETRKAILHPAVVEHDAKVDSLESTRADSLPDNAAAPKPAQDIQIPEEDGDATLNSDEKLEQQRMIGMLIRLGRQKYVPKDKEQVIPQPVRSFHFAKQRPLDEERGDDSRGSELESQLTRIDRKYLKVPFEFVTARNPPRDQSESESRTTTTHDDSTSKRRPRTIAQPHIPGSCSADPRLDALLGRIIQPLMDMFNENYPELHAEAIDSLSSIVHDENGEYSDPVLREIIEVTLQLLEAQQTAETTVCIGNFMKFLFRERDHLPYNDVNLVIALAHGLDLIDQNSIPHRHACVATLIAVRTKKITVSTLLNYARHPDHVPAVLKMIRDMMFKKNVKSRGVPSVPSNSSDKRNDDNDSSSDDDAEEGRFGNNASSDDSSSSDANSSNRRQGRTRTRNSSPNNRRSSSSQRSGSQNRKISNRAVSKSRRATSLPKYSSSSTPNNDASFDFSSAVAVLSTASRQILPDTDHHFIAGVSAKTKLLDLAFAQFGCLVGFASSATFIHENLIERVRLVYIHVLQQLTANILSIMWWKKFLLLPAVLFSCTNRATVVERMNDILADNWNLTIGDLVKKRIPCQQQNENDTTEEKLERLHRVVLNKIKHAELSAAMQTLCASLPIAPASTETVATLRDKHPPKPASCPLVSQEEILAIRKFKLDPTLRVHASVSQVRSIIRDAPRLKAPGIDMLRYDHLKSLVGKGVEAHGNEAVFSDLLTEVVNVIIAGEVPTEVMPALRDNHQVALLKPNGDIRPIGMGSVIRKIASSVCFQYTQQEFNKRHFVKDQLALVPGGIEHAVHSFQIAYENEVETEKDWHIVSLDADNAFNKASRFVGLSETKKHIPEMLPVMREMYLDDSNGWYYGLASGIEAIKSAEGYHQGDTMAGWGFLMTLNPLLKSLEEKIKDAFGEREHWMGKYYVDNLTFSASWPVMQVILSHIELEGKKYGFTFSKSKGDIIVPEQRSSQQAQLFKQKYASLGFSPEIIKLHPANTTNDVEAKMNYGLKLLGSFVGTEEFIQHQLNLYLDELTIVAEKLIAFPNIQGRSLLFRYCFIPKPIHVFRTVPPRICGPLIAGFEKLKQRILFSLLDCTAGDMTEIDYLSCNFPLNKGGLGFHLSGVVAVCSYVASFIAFSQSPSGEWLKATTDVLLNGENLMPHVEAAKKYMQSKCFCPEISDSREKIATLMTWTNSRSEGTVQSRLCNMMDVERIHELKLRMTRVRRKQWRAVQNEEAGKWLEAVPKYANLTMTNDEFVTALRYRLALKMPRLSPGGYCMCGNHGAIVDVQGNHFATGCAKYGYRKQTHDGVAIEFNSILRYCGFWTVREERGIFRATDPNNGNTPDISILNPIDPTVQKEIFDISITAPLVGAESGKLQSPKTDAQAWEMGTQAEIRHKDKIRHYDMNVINANGLGFHPIIFESTGFVHKHTRDYLITLAKRASEEKKIPSAILYSYFIKRLSVRLQKGISDAINRRIYRHGSRANVEETDPSFRVGAVLESADIR